MRHLLGERGQLAFQSVYPLLERPDLITQRGQTGAQGHRDGRLRIFDQRADLWDDVARAHWYRHAKLAEQSAQRIEPRRPGPDPRRAHAMEGRDGLLRHRLDRHRMDLLVPGRFEQRFRIRAIGLIATDIPAGLMRGQQLDGVAELFQGARPMVRRLAGFEQHGRGRALGEEPQEPGPGQPMLFIHTPRVMRDRHLEHGLGEVNGDRCMLHLDSSSAVARRGRFTTGTMMPHQREESIPSLVSGLQGAVWMLGAVPAVLRHDNLSAATHELKRSGGRQLTARFQQVMDHYGLRSSRIQPGKPHENGVAEQAHFRTKTAIEQALLLRGDREFADESAYLRFVRAVLDEERNRPAAARLAEERLYLQPLPTARIPEYTTFQCRVRKWSTIRIGSRIYSVPSRLIGHTVEARQHPSTVEVLYGGRVLCTMPRLRGAADHRIDYRHIIGSLVRKPGAFARYRFREELFPSLTFRAAYDALGRTHGERADVEYVRLLHLAATTSERQVEATLRARLDAGDTCAYASVQAEVRPPVPTVPVVHIPRPDLAQYDALLTGGLHG